LNPQVLTLIRSLLVGGGISDIEQNPPGRQGHWGRHGKWHDDVGISSPSTSTDAQAQSALAAVLAWPVALIASALRGGVGIAQQ
jgi:hypothetical protein